MKKRKIRTSLLAMTVVLVILLSVALAVAGFSIYRQDMIARYQNYAGDAIDCIARSIDGDDLERCIETGVKSEKYEEDIGDGSCVTVPAVTNRLTMLAVPYKIMVKNLYGSCCQWQERQESTRRAAYTISCCAV